MPYVHLDLPLAIDAGDRLRIAGRLSRLYAEVMQTSPQRPTVGFRELGEHGVLRLGAGGETEAVVLVQCDIRRGRSAEQRERLGAAIAAVLDEELNWPVSHTIVEFTQHAGDEFWRADGLSQDWAPSEASNCSGSVPGADPLA
jgi:phenylpyruvate tautomerase PptA (4-oxalocrotonate tautomerase family)